MSTGTPVSRIWYDNPVNLSSSDGTLNLSSISAWVFSRTWSEKYFAFSMYGSTLLVFFTEARTRGGSYETWVTQEIIMP